MESFQRSVEGRDVVTEIGKRRRNMPIIDMPIEELKTYEGTNPRPADFDEYWERALAEMHAVDAQVELVPSRFQVPTAECFDLYFTGVKGARIHAKYVRPKQAKEPHPAVISNVPWLFWPCRRLE